MASPDDSADRILVTGGAGYVGSHACKALAAAGYLPVTYDNLARGHEWAVRWGPCEPGDILDRARLDAVIARHRPSAVVHFAALANVGESVADPASYLRNNVAGSLTLLEAMRDHAIARIVVSSTCAVYGNPQTVPIGEDAALHPLNPYGRSKLMVEQMLDAFAAAHALRPIVLRYFNAAGADPDGEIGEAHDPETHLIPLALDAASGRGGRLTVFGDDYDTPDGTCIRDYVHVGDLANAHVSALKALEAGSTRGTFNLGTGNGYSVRQIIGAVEAVTGLAVPVAAGPRRAGDPPVLVADGARARAELGWKPGFEGLDAIVATAWAWHRKHYA
jgi:UDP-glucose-4-epimerase GalE